MIQKHPTRQRIGLVAGVFLFFVIFPFTQIIPLATYTQPYAILVAGLIVFAQPQTIQRLPQVDRLILIWLAILGALLLLIEATQGLAFREISFFLSYLTPLLITAASLSVIRRNPERVRKMLIIGILTWVSIGVIQVTVNPGFLTVFASSRQDLGTDIAASGRGALGLAPEPTHYGFYMVVLGTALYVLRGPIWVVLLAIAAAVLVAQSSSAVLAMGVGLLLWASMRPITRFWVFGCIAIGFAISAILPLIFEDNLRITRLILSVYEIGPGIIMSDYSVNARISGMSMPIYYSIESVFVPQGISLERWMEIRLELLAAHRWIVNLSENGPASGFGLILLQGGILGLPIFFYFFVALVVRPGGTLVGLLTASVFMTFSSQLYLATPGLGLVLAALINVRQQETQAKKLYMSPIQKTERNYPSSL